MFFRLANIFCSLFLSTYYRQTPNIYQIYAGFTKYMSFGFFPSVAVIHKIDIVLKLKHRSIFLSISRLRHLFFCKLSKANSDCFSLGCPHPGSGTFCALTAVQAVLQRDTGALRPGCAGEEQSLTPPCATISHSLTD